MREFINLVESAHDTVYLRFGYVPKGGRSMIGALPSIFHGDDGR